MMFIAGGDLSSEWAPPTGNYTVKLFRDDNNVCSGGGYADQVVAVTGAWDIVEGSGDAWSVKNTAPIRWPASGAATDDNWGSIATIRWFRTGETEPDFIFDLEALVVISSGGHYSVDEGELVLADSND